MLRNSRGRDFYGRLNTPGLEGGTSKGMAEIMGLAEIGRAAYEAALAWSMDGEDSGKEG